MLLHSVCRSCLRTKPRGRKTRSSHLVNLEVTRQTERKSLTLSLLEVEVIHCRVHEAPGMPWLGTQVLALFNSWLLTSDTQNLWGQKERALRDKDNEKIKRCPKMFTAGSESCMIILRKHPIVPSVSLKTTSVKCPRVLELQKYQKGNLQRNLDKIRNQNLY